MSAFKGCTPGGGWHPHKSPGVAPSCHTAPRQCGDTGGGTSDRIASPSFPSSHHPAGTVLPYRIALPLQFPHMNFASRGIVRWEITKTFLVFRRRRRIRARPRPAADSCYDSDELCGSASQKPLGRQAGALAHAGQAWNKAARQTSRSFTRFWAFSVWPEMSKRVQVQNTQRAGLIPDPFSEVSPPLLPTEPPKDTLSVQICCRPRGVRGSGSGCGAGRSLHIPCSPGVLGEPSARRIPLS